MNKKYTIFPSRHSNHFNVHTVLLSLIITFIYINKIRIRKIKDIRNMDLVKGVKMAAI